MERRGKKIHVENFFFEKQEIVCRCGNLKTNRKKKKTISPENSARPRQLDRLKGPRREKIGPPFHQPQTTASAQPFPTRLDSDRGDRSETSGSGRPTERRRRLT